MFGTQQLWTDEFLSQMRTEADPTGDQLVENFITQSGKESGRLLFDTLTDKLDKTEARFPEAILNFLGEAEELPEWADEKKIKLAETFFIDHGPHFLICLYYKSLPTLYSCANGAQALFHTGRLTYATGQERRFTRRISQTGKFILGVMLPESFSKEGNGIATIKRVRLIHSAIRHFMPKDRWQEGAWGKVINQEDLAITLMTFSISMLDGLDILGLPYTDEEADAYLHVWQIVGHFLGIRHDLIPQTVADGRLLLQKILDRQASPSEAGQILTQALIGFGEDVIPGKAMDVVPASIMQMMLSSKLQEILDVHPKRGFWGRLIPAFMRVFFKLEEKLDAKDTVIAKKLHNHSLNLTHWLVNYMLKHSNIHPREQSAVLKRWGISEQEA